MSDIRTINGLNALIEEMALSADKICSTIEKINETLMRIEEDRKEFENVFVADMLLKNKKDK